MCGSLERLEKAQDAASAEARKDGAVRAKAKKSAVARFDGVPNGIIEWLW